LQRPDSPAPFEEPWQAQALAIAQSLQDAGVISPAQWSQALGAAIERAQAAGDPDRGDTYYLHVLDALEHLLAEHDLVSFDSLQVRKSEWEAAYRRTPHGQPVEL
jgi:nitrile hydratase accessory protein